MAKKKDNWIGKATAEMKKKGTVGLFTKKAKAKGMTAQEYADQVLENPKGKSLKLRREAQFAHEMGEIAKDRRKRKYKKGGRTQGYNDKLNESLSMRTGNRKSKSQTYKDRRDESKAANKTLGRRAYQSVGTMDNEDWERGWKMKKGGKTQGYDDKQDESLGMRRGKQSSKKVSAKGRRDDSYGKWGKRDQEGRHISMSHGGKTQGYDDKQDESLGMRTGKESSKKQSMKARREDSYGKWGKRGKENRKISMKKGGETQKKADTNQTMLLGGIAGILLGAFLGRK